MHDIMATGIVLNAWYVGTPLVLAIERPGKGTLDETCGFSWLAWPPGLVSRWFTS